MPSVSRILEVLVYSLLNFFPFLVLALYPFRHCLRFSKVITGTLIGFLTVIQVLLGAWVSFVSGNHSAIASAVSTILYAAFYFLAVKKHFGKTLFTLLMISNLVNLAVISAKCLEGLFFPTLATQHRRSLWNPEAMEPMESIERTLSGRDSSMRSISQELRLAWMESADLRPRRRRYAAYSMP